MLNLTVRCKNHILQMQGMVFYNTLLMMIYLSVNKQIKTATVKSIFDLKDFMVFFYSLK